MDYIDEKIIKKVINESKFNNRNNYKKGGPFGAIIIKDSKIIASAHNTVIESNDATAHAEINAIRQASKILNSYDLNGCIILTSTEPCPMCLSAIIWSNIKNIYYLNTRKQVEDIGFRDNIIYEYLRGNSNIGINMYHIENKEALEVLKKYKEISEKNVY